MKTTTIKLAVQKDGRLAEGSLVLLRKAGLDFECYTRQLLCPCRNFPLEILFVRDDDIAGYVESGVVDLGILGQNILYESRPQVRKLLNLQFGRCSLSLSVPKDSNISTLKELSNKTIATSYPNSVRAYLGKNDIEANILTLSGSVEIAPALGIADVIADLLSSGSTLKMNDLKPLQTIYESEAVLIANRNLSATVDSNAQLRALLLRFESVLSAANYKNVSMEIPILYLSKARKILGGIKGSIRTAQSSRDTAVLQTVITQDRLWETVEKMKAFGVSNIFVSPVENIIS